MMHMGVTKDYAIGIIRSDGAAAILPNWSGTDDEAVQAITNDPREVFASCDCVKSPTGACTGAAKEE